MKAAVIGIGKTGSKVVELLDESEIFGAYNSRNLPDEKVLSGADIIIVFVPNKNLESLSELLIDSGRPVIWGVTGYEIPEDIKQRINAGSVPWIYSANFSLGMNIIRDVLRVLRGGLDVLSDPKISINEIHHTKKIDAPSGTALVWKNIINNEVEVTSERVGDVVGTHQLKIATDTEEIYLEHKALDRSIFAQGAIWAAKQVTKEGSNLNGLISFEDFTKEIIRKYL
ncbi:MAG: hypothetical protein JEY94_03960 [Melioribacteraceae bacterium]|nr:hypothetical protein [Melioribacteraceae bacterium]